MKNEITLPAISLDHIPELLIPEFAQNIKSLLNFTGVSTGRATHYNTLEEQQEKELEVHKSIFKVDRSIYGLLMMLPGVTDHSKMRACTALLGNKYNGEKSILPFDKEKLIIKGLVNLLPSQRSIKLFKQFKKKRINNTRTRKLILDYILNSPNLELWTVKYRKKLRDILIHCWGEKKASLVKNLLSRKLKDDISEREINILDNLDSSLDLKKTECINFILGGKALSVGSKLITEFHLSSLDIVNGKNLPIETLQGIRSTYHKDTTQEELLSLVKDNLTKTQKRQIQKKAKNLNIEVEFNPFNYSLVELYIYVFEMGMNEEIWKAIVTKAKKTANTLPFKFDKIGILLDDSYSMTGSKEQKLRPMAMALAIKDVLKYAGKESIITSVQGNSRSLRKVIKPSGNTDLASGLIYLLENEVDSIFIISDGYENSPEGRLAEVLKMVRKIGNDTPVYHINPVVASNLINP